MDDCELKEEAQEEALEEINNLFHETYSGSHYPTIDAKKVLSFSKRAINTYERILFYKQLEAKK